MREEGGGRVLLNGTSWIMYTVLLQDWQAPKREGGAGGGWGLKIAGRRH